MACAAVGLGFWPGYESVQGVHQLRSRCTPARETQSVYRALLPVFQQAASMQAELGERLARL